MENSKNTTMENTNKEIKLDSQNSNHLLRTNSTLESSLENNPQYTRSATRSQTTYDNPYSGSMMNRDSYSNYNTNQNDYNSYGGYSRSNSAYPSYSSYNNQYSSMNGYDSNPMMNNSNPMMNNNLPPGHPQAMQSTTFKTDFWGVLNGFSCVLNILYAGSGLVNYGKIFAKMSLRIIKFVCGRSLPFIMKITGLSFLKNMLFKAARAGWSDEFTTPSLLNTVWDDSELTKYGNSTILGKLISALRICSLLGALLFMFLRRRTISEPEYFAVNAIEQNCTPAHLQETNLPNDVTESGLEALTEEKEEDEIKTAEEGRPKSVTEVVADVTDQESASLPKLNKNSSLTEKIPSLDKTTSILNSPLLFEDKAQNSIQLNTLNNVELSTSASLTKENTVIITDETPKKSDNLPVTDILFTPEDSTNESSKLNETIKNNLRSEDFWINASHEPVSSVTTVETIAKSTPEIEEPKAFEAPPMLRTLSSTRQPSSGSLPWMKKQKSSIIQ
jgi:hypothetical protein